MAVANISEERFRSILGANFTPSATIKTPERLFGRHKALQQIDRALASQGRQIFIYGDRGVGKSSLALTAGYIQNSSEFDPIYVACGRDDSFASVVKAVGDQTLNIRERFESGGQPGQFSGSLFGVGGSAKRATKPQPAIKPPASINEALDILRYVLDRRQGNVIVIVDEMERMHDAKEREKFAELVKNVPELDDRLRFIFCGIARNIDDLIGSHPSAGRILEAIQLERLPHNFYGR